MSKTLIVDVGAGTLDLLCHDDESGLHYKAVARSPVLYMPEMVERTPGDLLFLGGEMGGGRLAQVLRERAERHRVVMSRSAAMTVGHDIERVRSWGITVIEDEEALALSVNPAFSVLELGDFQPDQIRRLVEGLALSFDFDVIGVCAQDHGMPPAGCSHLEFRHNAFQAVLERRPVPEALLYEHGEIPLAFNRLRSIAESVVPFAEGEVYLMDSGMAAILGASLDFDARGRRCVLVLDVATSHTVGAAVQDGTIAGFFEYHTRDLTLDRLETLLVDLAEGRIDHRRILEEGGHGAFLRHAVGFGNVEAIIATGPKRRLVAGSRLPVRFGAPLGDNMMTGTLGMLEAIRRRKGLPPAETV